MSALFWTSYVVLWILVAIFAVALLALYHHFGEMYLNSREGRDRQGPDVGTVLGSAQLVGVDGGTIALPPARPALLLFMSTDCKLCGRLRDVIAEFAERHDELETLVVCAGQASQVREWAARIEGRLPVGIDPQHRLAARYKIGMTPFVVGARGDGTVVLRGLFNDIDGLELAAEQLEREVGLRPLVDEIAHFATATT